MCSSPVLLPLLADLLFPVSSVLNRVVVKSSQNVLLWVIDKQEEEELIFPAVINQKRRTGAQMFSDV